MAFSLWYVNALVYSVLTQDETIASFCSVQTCLVTPVLLDSTFVSPFSRGSTEGGGFQVVVMRNLRMRRLHCATSVAPCSALVFAAPALYRWLRLHRQVYRFIPDLSVFFPVPFSTRTASQTAAVVVFVPVPLPRNWCSQVELHGSSRPSSELLETAAVEQLSGRVHLVKVECV
jgi:hypothetical protein